MPRTPETPTTPRSRAESWLDEPVPGESPVQRDEEAGSQVGEDANAPRIVYDEENMNSTLPRLHLTAYRGDLAGVLQCITDGHSVADTVVMRNQAGRLVCGITPLFLAAQKGHYKVVKLLVGNGANPNQPAYIEGSVDFCTPVQVARLNFNVKVTYYLTRAVAARKAEDKVLKEEEQQIDAARAAIPTALAGAGPMQNAIVNVGDLTTWDPESGDQPPAQSQSIIKRFLKVNLLNKKWNTDGDMEDKGYKPSESRVIDPEEAEIDVAQVHGHALSAFLQDADLARWNPHEGSMVGGAPTTIAAGGSQFNSRANSPGSIREYGNQPATIAARATGRAAAQPASRARAPAASSRWYAHGESDSDEEGDDEQFQASASRPAAAPVSQIVR